MILTVTLNAALDVTYRVSGLRPGTTHRVDEVTERAGGKGVNVARVLYALGEPVLATGFVGGATGERIRGLLTASGVRHTFVSTVEESRRTVVVAGGDPEPTGFWEPGPSITATEWAEFLRRYRALLAVARVVVLSGSLPPGVPADAYHHLIRLARGATVPAVLDADGPALRDGLPAGPDLVKPNAAELGTLTGLAGWPAVDRVRELGAGEVVASSGAAGVWAATSVGCFRARLPQPVRGNPTGAGDTCVAALARGIAHRHPWPRRLVDAVALAAASVSAPVAGAAPTTLWRRLRPQVIVESR